MPSTASSVAAALGSHAGAFDLDAACAGFVHALAVTSSALAGGLATRALVIGADTMSRVVDPEDRSTAVLFGDGAAALLLEADESASGHLSPDGHPVVPGLVAADLVTRGAGAALLRIDGGGSGRPLTAASLARGEQFLKMDGPALFHQVVREAAASAQRVVEGATVAPDDIAWFVPHQANARITEAVAARIGIDPVRVASNIASTGNTSAASVPLLLAELASSHRICDGDLLLVSGFGAGMSVASALWHWKSA